MAASTSQPKSREPSYQELVKPASQWKKPKDEVELRKEAEQWFRRDSDELEEMEGLLPSVNFPDRRVQIEELRKEAEQFETDFAQMEMKIHRFPASLQGIDKKYISPMVVSIDLYHHNASNLQEMEKVKRVAAHHFISESGFTFDEMYAHVFSVIGTAHRFYDANVNVGDAEFADIMFIDGCFLLQYMSWWTKHQELHRSLVSCFMSNRGCINNDIMLLENQLPWLVVHTLRRFSSVPVDLFIHRMGYILQIRGDTEMELDVLDGSDMQPHLLGILWSYKTRSIRNSGIPMSDSGVSRSMSKIISAIELGEIGIKLTTSKTTKFADMGVKKGFLSSEIFLAPLVLDDITSCWFVNMAAFEVSMGLDTFDRNDNYQIKSIVCSYIAVHAMLMDREEDVHELRSKRLVEGELTNKEILDFFKMLAKRIYGGPHCVHIMSEVEAYKLNRWMWIKVHRFIYKNFKAIVTVLSIIGVLVGIFKTLLSLKKQ